MTVAGVLRLERYAQVLSQFGDQERVPLSSFLLAVETVSLEQLKRDFEQLGLAHQPAIKVSEAGWAISHVLASTRRSDPLQHPRSPVVLVDTGTIENAIMKAGPDSLHRAMTREAAWNLMIEHPDFFVFSLGRLMPMKAAFPHQVKTVKRVLETFCGQAIVADEVGLGKTLVGALLVIEALERRSDAHVLVLTPSNLVEQWIREFERFFGLNLGEVPYANVEQLASEPIVLLSIDRAKGPAIAPFILQRRWDLLLIDEAHEIRNPRSVRARFVYTIHAVNRVYLTATPVQNSGYDIYHVVNSLRPGFLNVKAWFTQNYMLDERSVREPEALQERIGEVMTRTTRREVGEEGFARRSIETRWVEQWTEREASAYRDLLEMLRGTYRRHLGYAAPIRRASGSEQHVSQFVLVAMLVLREMSSHTKAALKTLNTALRARLEALAQGLQEITRTRAESSDVVGGTWDIAALDRFIEEHGQDLDRSEAHAKAAELLDQLRQLFKEPRSVLVYVCFHETLTVLARLVRHEIKGVNVVEFHGELSKEDKQSRIEEFRQMPPACLISTDAGGQGLNLQTADVVINYDYPWNPMKLEQRIGRVDRYGQEHEEVKVINLVTKGTIERYVYETLQTKLEVFEHVVGDMLSPLSVEDVIESRIMLGIGELILSSPSTEEMRARFEGLDEESLRGYMDRYQRYAAWRERWISE